MSDASREARLGAAFVALADTLTSDYDMVDLLHTLLDECVDVLAVNAGGLMISNSLGQLELLASTSERAELVELMQLSAGSGPCIECFTSRSPVAIADIRETTDRWPDFSATALRQGFHSVTAVPLKLRGQIIGTMNLFAHAVGTLTTRDGAIAQALADVATIGILQERAIRETTIVTEQLQRALDSRILIEQAKGVLSEIGSMDMEEAFRALRSYARNNNLSLRKVAEQVVDRTLDVLTAPLARRADSAPKSSTRTE
jgi:GAF domain-containing protein